MMQRMAPSTSSRRTTPERDRARFRLAHALADERTAAGMTQTELGQRVDPYIPQKTMSRIELGEFTTMGTGAHSRVVGMGIGLIVEFERVLRLQPGHLPQIAGYLPPAERSVLVAIEHDPRLPDEAKAALTAAYRHLVRPVRR